MIHKYYEDRYRIDLLRPFCAFFLGGKYVKKSEGTATEPIDYEDTAVQLYKI